MARPVNFNQTEVLDKLTLVFWEKGFYDSSIEDLSSASGLNRSSLYNSFGNKEAIFKQVLKHYQEHYSKQRLEQILKTSPVKKALEEYFLSLIETEQNRRLGCLLVNTSIELSPHNSQIDKDLQKSFKKVENIFYQVLEKAQNNNEIDSNKDISLIAKYLLNNVYGIRVSARAGSTKKDLKQIVKVILKSIY